MSPYEGNGGDGRHYWLTPPDLMRALQEEFAFDYDPCPHPRPEGYDGLTAEWGQSNYVNPPFKGPTAWVRKAIAEHQKGKTVVFVFPIDKWVHMLLEAGAKVRNLRDVKWCATEDGQPGKGSGRHIAAFILDSSEPSDASRAPEGTAPEGLEAALNTERGWSQQRDQWIADLRRELAEARAAIREAVERIAVRRFVGLPPNVSECWECGSRSPAKHFTDCSIEAWLALPAVQAATTEGEGT